MFLKTKLPGCNCFRSTTSNNFGTTSIATPKAWPTAQSPRQANTVQYPAQTKTRNTRILVAVGGMANCWSFRTGTADPRLWVQPLSCVSVCHLCQCHQVMLKSAMKQNCRRMSKCRCSATNQGLFETEGYIKNWTTLRSRTAIKVNTTDTRLDLFISN